MGNVRQGRAKRRDAQAVCDRDSSAEGTLGSALFSVIRIAANRFPQFFLGAGHTSPEDLLHAARVLLWVRWFGLTAAFVEIHYRVDYGSLSHILNTLYCLAFLAANGYVQWLIHRRGMVKPAWLFALSALDLAAISFRLDSFRLSVVQMAPWSSQSVVMYSTMVTLPSGWTWVSHSGCWACLAVLTWLPCRRTP